MPAEIIFELHHLGLCGDDTCCHLLQLQMLLEYYQAEHQHQQNRN
jgi:hypothetical protein